MRDPLPLLRGGIQTTPAAAMLCRNRHRLWCHCLNPDRLESFRQVGARPDNGGDTPGTKPALLANTGLDYQDIQPWLGDEITLAVTTIDD